MVGDAVGLGVELAQRLVHAHPGRPRGLRCVAARRGAKHRQQHAQPHHRHLRWCRLRRPAVVRRR
eukprot:5105464-Prymnesium_polylepis.4